MASTIPAEARELSIERLGSALGARITGIDLSRTLAPETVAAIKAAFLTHHVLCFPNQDISAEDQARFAGMLGQADYGRPREVKNEGRNRDRGIMLITNIREDGKPIGALPDGEMHFHSDGAHRDVPYRGTTLYAQRIPTHGGETKFANLIMAYEALPDEMKTRIEGLKARYIYDVYATLRDQIDDADLDRLSNSAHPLVRVHSETGRKSLYLSRLMARDIVGMEKSESERLLGELFNHAEKPEFVYIHKWTVGDLLVWDNRCLNHARNDFPADQIRLMRRLTISEPA